MREAGRTFPGRLDALDAWTPPWRAQPAAEDVRPGRGSAGGRPAQLLAAYPATCDAMAELVGCEGTWHSSDPGSRGVALAARHRETACALEALPAAS
ncbi:hypothetical protein DQ392_07795 [Streptomyces reniochalinae]|uniref:Uncharacterized protein n=1 Tax=Streptomyces reniochalinae TaxID=2250578 RepID=A0A367EU31_9ACTN|nr:hypothetical protein DQ392_07795 [Streptomyces reniochalinae]